MRTRRVTASLAVLLLAAAIGQASAARSRAPVLGLGAPVLGLDWPSGGTRLAHYDALNLRRLGAGLRLPAAGWVWRMSPDRAQLALSSGARTLVVIDAARLHREAVIRPGVANPVAIIWPRADRIVVIGQNRDGNEAQIALVDPASGRILRRARLAGRLVAGDVTPDGVALLLGPRVGIGRARLVLVDVDLRTLAVALPRTRTGWVRLKSQASPSDPQPRVRVPGLAVDAAGGHAWVVAQDQPLGEIDLRSGTVTYRPLRVRRPAAAAKDPFLGSTHHAARPRRPPARPAPCPLPTM